MSFGQERLWFLHRLDPRSTEYNISGAYRIRGPLDTSAFTAAFLETVGRHEPLRTSISMTSGAVGQVVWPVEAVEPVAADLGRLPVDQRLAEARRMAAQDAATPFDLEAGPPLRHTLVRLGPEEHVWLFTVHHIACDGWSVTIIWRELAAHYIAMTAGRECALPALPLRFADHARQERERERDGVFDRHFDYWRRQLSGISPLALPTDHPYPPFPSSRGSRLHTTLPAWLTADLRRFSRENSATPFMTFLAAFQLLLARYCGQRDIAVGLPVDGRSRAEIEPLAGFFVNTVVLRADVAPRSSFRDLLAQARATVLDALDHQDLPFGRLVTRLRPPRDPARPPLFQAMIAAEDPPVIPAIPGLRIDRIPVARASAQFELSLSLHSSEHDVAASIEYATDLFRLATIERMAGHYRVLLEGILSDPDRRLDRLPLLTDGERTQLLAAGRGPDPGPSPAGCLPELVGAWAKRDPESLAVVHGDRRLTFAELDAAAARLAERLRRLGIAPGAPVGLCVGRCPELVIGMLGILAAGAACVPISPALPANRVAYLVDDAGIEFVVADEAIPAQARIVPVRQDNAQPVTGGEPGADDVAFVLYTSGSTGAPKGVELTHGALASLFTAMVDGHKVAPGDRVLSFCALGTDMCVEEIFLALCGGATVVITDDVVDIAPRFFATCQRLGVTIVNLPTAYWHELANDTELPGRLRLILTGGDRASPPLFRRWLEHAGRSARLVNAYGPTETTINATQYELVDAAVIQREVPIGRPFPGVDVYVLDAGFELVPVGVTGELCVGGPRVARGYRGRPGQTAERFVPDPYGGEPGGRLYRTGDLVRWRADGLLEFVGRTDTQVKIRGYRVEPGEIETVLGSHPSVGNAVVVGVGDHQLAAYVVSTKDHPGIGRELRGFLAERLPDYMVPATIVPLAELPLTATGKVDRKALPDPAAPATVAGPAPRTALERVLAGLWAEVLRATDIGIHDNFFDLGGHSLQTVQLATRVSAAVGADVPVKLILQHPTVAELAEALTTLTTLPPEVPRPAIPRPRRTRAQDFVEFESRPLLSLIEAGELPAVDAATVSCVPEALLAKRNLSAEEYIADWCQGVALVSGIKDSPLGRIALMMLPFPESRAYTDPAGLVGAVLPGLRIAGRIGAKVVSMINILPSATGYGRMISDAIAGRTDLPQITTGHATTTAAVVLNIERILSETGRPIGGESMAFIGLGSIGRSTLRLLLRRLPHPRRILLCDLYSRRAHLDEIRAEVEEIFDGPVEIAESAHGAVPGSVYGASLIVAATNVPDVVEVDRLAPGCIVVDDSAPHCFDPAKAIRRWHEKNDLICVEGGGIRSPDPITELRYVPSWVARGRDQAEIRDWFEPDRHNIGGCVMSSLLTARFDEVPVTIGLAGLAAGERNVEVLGRLGFTASDPLLENELLTAGQLASFRAAHGVAGTDG